VQHSAVNVVLTGRDGKEHIVCHYWVCLSFANVCLMSVNSLTYTVRILAYRAAARIVARCQHCSAIGENLQSLSVNSSVIIFDDSCVRDLTERRQNSSRGVHGK
jgi:hypothetical protein